MADYLDADLELIAPDPDTGELKATPYFEDYLYNIIAALGGEGSSVVGDLIAVTFESDKFAYYSGLVKTLSKQVEEIQHTINSPILDAKVKLMQKRLDELDSHFDNYSLSALVNEIDFRTSSFNATIKTTNYTAKNKDYVEARNGITVFLPENSVRGDEIMIANGDGSLITVLGNGTDIKYKRTDDTFVTRNIGSSYHFHLFVDNPNKYWRVR